MATTPAYFAQNPDVAQAYKENTYGLTPQEFADTHFALYGQTEQRAAPVAAVTPTVLSNVIDTIGSNTVTTTAALPAYFAQNPDVAAAYKVNTYGLTPEQYAAEHYKLYGGKEQRANPTAVTAITSGDLSSLPKYFQQNPDVAKSYLTNTYGLTPDQFAAKHYELYGMKEQRVSPTGAAPIIPKAVTPVTPTTPVSPTGVTTPTTQVGQFRELFPSFAESKRVASEMVANRPSMQSIISMIQGGKPSELNTSNILGGQLPAYFTQNPDVAAAYKLNTYGLTPEQFALTHYQKFGKDEQRVAPTTFTPVTQVVNPITTGANLPYFQANPDVAASYLTNNYGLTPEQFAATHYQKFGQNEQRVSPTGVAPVTQTVSGLPSYFTQNPDVAAAYAANNYGLSPTDFAATHFNLYGQAEQRAAPTSLANVINTIAK